MISGCWWTIPGAGRTAPRQAAWESGDRSAEARALNNLAAVYRWRAEYAQAGAHYRAAVKLFREAGDRVGEADALANLGMLDQVSDRVAALVAELGDDVQVGFHGHENLGLGVANSVWAVRAGATQIDGSTRRFGVGAEILVRAGERRLVGGQEDQLIDIAVELCREAGRG